MTNNQTLTRDALDAIYEASLDAFGKASRTYSANRVAYREHRITDKQFAAARTELDKAHAVADEAERVYIEAVNALECHAAAPEASPQVDTFAVRS